MKDIPTSPRIIEIRHNRRVKKIRLIILFFILTLSIIGALSFFSKDDHVVIDKVVVTGTHIINHEDIEKEVLANLSGKYFYLFSRSNSFIYPHKKIYDNLILKFPRIEKISIYKDNLKTLHIDVSERMGSFLYCGVNIPTEKNDIGENCYFINNDGFIFDKAPYFSGNVYFKYYMALKDNGEDPLGKQMTDIDHFRKLTQFIDGVTSLGFKPVYLVTESDGTDSLYLNNNTASLPKIIFKDDADLNVILDNFSLAMGKKEFANEINGKYDTLLYIDLRFKNKVLYKFE